MTRLLVLYNQPVDREAFDRYYFETHVPTANRLPGLRSYTVSACRPGLLAGEQAPYLVAELEFDNEAALQAALGSTEGRATVDDLPNFAGAGVTVMTFDMRKV